MAGFADVLLTSRCRGVMFLHVVLSWRCSVVCFRGLLARCCRGAAVVYDIFLRSAGALLPGLGVSLPCRCLVGAVSLPRRCRGVVFFPRVAAVPLPRCTFFHVQLTCCCRLAVVSLPRCTLFARSADCCCRAAAVVCVCFPRVQLTCCCRAAAVVYFFSTFT